MENKYVCSVDIGGTKIATAIMEYPADGSVPHPVFEAEVPTEAQEGGEAVFQRIEASIKAALEANPDVEVLGVGIGAAGVVDPKTGAIAYANEIMPGWSGVQLGPRPAGQRAQAVVGDVQATAGPITKSATPQFHRRRTAVDEHRYGHRRRICRERPRDARRFHGRRPAWATVRRSAAAGIPCACGRSEPSYRSCVEANHWSNVKR